MKRLVLMACILLTVTSAFPRVLANGSGGGGPKALVEERIAVSATHFLLSQSAAYRFLAEFERTSFQPMDFAAARLYVAIAVSELEMARDTFGEMLQLSPGTVDKQQLAQLEEFNYKGFAAKRSLNPEIARLVQGYLVKGDLRSAHLHHLASLDQTLQTLVAIEEAIEINQEPDIELVHQLLQQYAETSLFGNYLTRIYTTAIGADATSR